MVIEILSVKNQMKRSFLLGVLGGIFSFSMGILAFLIMAINQANGAIDTDLTINIVLVFLAGTLGIIGSAIGNRIGGAVLIASAMLALIATSLFGIPSFVFLLVAGVLSFREKGTKTEIEYPVADGVSKGKKRSILFYVTIISCLAGIIALIFSGLNLWHTYFLQPRAKLTVSIGAFHESWSETSASMSIPVSITNYSPRTANILKDWNLTLVFTNSTFQFPNQNCTYGTTELHSAQQTEFVFSYDITNDTSIDVNTLQRVIFTISYIDDQGTQTQQFEFIRPHS